MPSTFEQSVLPFYSQYMDYLQYRALEIIDWIFELVDKPVELQLRLTKY